MSVNLNLKSPYTLSFLVVALAIGCSGSKTDKFPLEKRFWVIEDYGNAIRQIEFETPTNEKYPMLRDPETAPIFKKLVDRQNISAVAEDNTLGIRHRADFTDGMFDEYKKLANLYSGMNREDKYVYDQELVEIYRFGAYLQIWYFKLGNEKILQNADNAAEVRTLVSQNEQTVISNFNNYLDFVNNENSFSEGALKNYSDGIDESFSQLLDTFPKGDYYITLRKATDMEKKATNSDVKTALSNLIQKLNSKIESASQIVVQSE